MTSQNLAIAQHHDILRYARIDNEVYRPQLQYLLNIVIAHYLNIINTNIQRV